MVYDGRAVANHFLELARQGNEQLTHMKLQKLLYFAHGWHLAFFGEPLVAEGFQAWQYGPVSQNVYDWFRKFGAKSIDEPAARVVTSPGDPFGFALMPIPPIPGSDQQTLQHIEKVYRAYKRCTAGQMSAATHEPDTPWSQVRGKYGDVKVHIDNPIIKQYFNGCMEKARVAAEARQ
jgi:uncharacterized phage-associated protein